MLIKETKLKLGPSLTYCKTLRWFLLKAYKQFLFYLIDILNYSCSTGSSNEKEQLFSPNSERFIFFLNTVGISFRFQMYIFPFSDKRANNSSSYDTSIPFNYCFTLTTHPRDSSDCFTNP